MANLYQGSLWIHHTWKQIENLDPDKTIFVIPTGAIEQHGPHLPVDTDIFNANAIAEYVAKKSDLMSVIVLPPIWWGTSPHHKGYPGTLSLRLETFYHLLHDLIESVKSHGFYRFLILNGHGGNAGIITAATSQISFDLGISISSFSYWQSIHETLVRIGDSPIGGMGHACEMETSLALYLRPELVDVAEIRSDLPEQRSPWSCIDFRQPGFLGIGLDFRRDSKEGVMGDPTLATAEKGKIIFESACQAASDVIYGLAKLKKENLMVQRF